MREATAAYERFRLNDAALAVHRFLWSDLADWYIEVIKPRLYGEQPGGDVARAVATQTFDVALRLLHPVMPFITETLWRRLPRPHRGRLDLGGTMARRGSPGRRRRGAAPLRCAAGAGRRHPLDPGRVRGATRPHGAGPDRQPGADVTAVLDEDAAIVSRLAKLSSLEAGAADAPEGAAHAILPDGTAVSVPLGDLVDVQKECARLGTEMDRLNGAIRGQESKLENPQFTAKAPQAVVEREREKLAAWREQAGALAEKRRRLGCPV